MKTDLKQRLESVSFRYWLWLPIVVSALLLSLNWLHVAAAPPPPLPPVPTVTPTPIPTPTPAPTQTPAPVLFSGAFIELHVQFPQSWPWDKSPWQALYTVVQWQDAEGHWHDVEGWRGGLDAIAATPGGMYVGRKTWWLAEANFGAGPFRWQVYRGQTDRHLAMSAAFNLPAQEKRTLVIEVTPAP